MRIVKLQSFFLACLFFSINFEVWDPLNTGGYFSLSKFFGILYFLAILPNINKFIAVPKTMRGILIPLILFYTLLFLMNVFNLGYNSSDVLSFSILINIVFFVFIVNHERLAPGAIEKAFIGYFFGAILSTLAYYLGIGVEVEIDGRVSLFGDNQNIIGVRMVIASFLLTHYLLKYGRAGSKLIVIISMLLYIPIVILLLSTGSRVAAISFMVGLSLFFLLYPSKKLTVKLLVATIFVALSGVVLDYIINSDVVGKRLLKTVEDRDLAGRDDIWRVVWPLVEDNIILGVGQTGYIEFTYKTSGEYFSSHNVILEIMSYTGVVGLTLYFIFIYRAFLSSLLYYFKYKELIPLLFIIPIAGLLVSGQILVFKLGWFIIAYAATRKYYNK